MSINGITTISHTHPGPHLVISYFTHGDEPVGKKIVDYLIKIYDLEKNLLKGSVSCMHINLEASKAEKRYIDHNMNRIWNQPFQKNSYEHQRKKELQPFLDTIDVLFDIHSTSKPNPCVCITDKQFLQDAKGFFSGNDIWIGNMQQQGSMIGYFIGQGKAGFGIEAGSHNDKLGYTQGLQNVLNFLSYYGVIKRPVQNTYYEAVYHFLDEIHCMHSSFTYTRNFSGLQHVAHNEIIAQESSRIIRNSYKEDNIYFGLAAKQPIAGDGAGFFFQKIE